MTTNILILCTHNSARSVLGEAMINHWGQRLRKDVRAFSAGSTPRGSINPFALEVLQLLALPLHELNDGALREALSTIAAS